MINQLIAKELKVNKNQIDATVALIDEGATIPFIARYRKEATGGLDDTQLRYLSERLIYLREMEDRRQSILSSITEQGKLTDDLKKSIIDADTKARLEDLYLPYKQKRRTKGQIAIEAGLEPLADLLINDPTLEPEKSAQDYINPSLEINDSTQALEGARYILMERFSEEADLRNILRDYLQQNSVVVSRVIKGKESEAQKYQDYFDYQEPWKNVPSHRALAILRGRKEGFLSVALHEPGQEELKIGEQGHCARLVGRYFGIEQKGRAGDAWLQQLVYYTWKIKLLISMESELLMSLRERSENDAIQVFAANLKDILMGAPAGSKRVLGLDPGIRTGVKVAVVDETGKVLDTSTIYPFQPQNKMQESIMTIGALCQKHNIDIIAIGNGTASRETDRMVADMMKVYPKIKVQKIIISEAGASVYSASELAAKEMPDLDVSLRGAVSIARRLQDPLAELVKIEPKSIGVGQYQHDVSQLNLSRSLTAVIEDCVNAVGVDINTASAALLSHVSGLNAGMAENIVMHRDTNGRFNTRKQLLDVSRLGPKAFEQAAGFLRILEGGEILDSSAVHPESYSLVIKMAKDKSVEIQELLGNKSLLNTIDAKAYVDDKVGLPTINDILSELDKPGRDPRPDFKTANFSDGVESIKDLKPGMWLEGVISNVAQFGAFVDIGVHQDGLVHISMLADTFIDDPRKVVKAGDVVRVKVLEVEVDRKRISLSMIDVPLEQGSSKGRADKKSEQAAKPKEHQPNSSKQSRSKPSASQAGKSNKGMGAMAKAFANLNK